MAGLRWRFAALVLAVVVSLSFVQPFTVQPSPLRRSGLVLHAKGFGSSPPPSPGPSKKGNADAGPMGAPTKGGAGEIDLGAMGGNPSVGGEISTAPTGKTDDEIFTEFGVATPQVKRTERKEEMQREFQQRADAVTQSDGNFITNLPAGLQVGIERVLLATLLGLGTVFILDGILITWDAFVISSKKELSPAVAGLAAFAEPLFTPLIVTLFGNSIVLGLFKYIQFSAPAATYKED